MPAMDRAEMEPAGTDPAGTAGNDDGTVDVVAIGHAIVDVLVTVDDDFVARQGLAKGSMSLVDADTAARLHELIGPGTAVSGGSAANTAVGVASLGGRAAFVGKVGDDELGSVFAGDIRAAGVRFPGATGAGAPTASCVVLVTPDAQRTMSTFLGVAPELGADDVDEQLVAGAAVTYVEGYLWGLPATVAALDKALSAAGRLALSLSDAWWVEAQRQTFLDLLPRTGVLFANEAEAMALYQVDALEDALRRLAEDVPLAAVTRAAEGSVVVADGSWEAVAAHPVDRVVDTTGAGDLYAAGFLYGLTTGMAPLECARIGGLAAAEVISHVGARPQVPLSRLLR
jgi:sugar/nucleoside kinase (ribokinase family)